MLTYIQEMDRIVRHCSLIGAFSVATLCFAYSARPAEPLVSDAPETPSPKDKIPDLVAKMEFGGTTDVNDTKLNAGLVPANAERLFKILLVNNTGEKIEIKRITSSCGCVGVKLEGGGELQEATEKPLYITYHAGSLSTKIEQYCLIDYRCTGGELRRRGVVITGEVRGVIDVFPALSRIVIDKADPERGLQFIVRSNFGSPISSIDSKTEKGVYAVNTESVDGKEARMTLKLRNVNTVNQVSSGWDAISLTVNFADATPSEKMTVHSFFVVEDAIVPTPTIVTPKQLADGISVTLLNKQGGIPDLEHFRLSARLNENDLLLVRNVRKLSDYMVRFDIKVSPETEIPVGSDRLDLELKMGDDSFQTAIKIVGL